MSEQDPLLPATNGQTVTVSSPSQTAKGRAWVHGALTVLFAVALGVCLGLSGRRAAGDDPLEVALRVLQNAPVIDGHIDLPDLVREFYRNNVSAVDLAARMPGHVDIPRLREGRVGGVFWSVYAGCPEHEGYDAGEEFLNGTWRVRDTLEQIDVAKALIRQYPHTFQPAFTSQDIRKAIGSGKIASVMGVEGAHQLGNSLSVLRQYYDLGVRYVTLAHMCHNVFADSCGFLEWLEPLHGGLSEFGYTLVSEMNRIGMLVDLSHTADTTAKQALKHTVAPVIWSHSSARAIWNVPRNVPDDVLELVGIGQNKTDGVVMVNFAPEFVAAEGNATLGGVADHIEHIAKIAGKMHVGLGSDFDGIGGVPRGLEDVSKYPQLFAELYKRGWSRQELAGLSGENLLRVMEGAENVAKQLQDDGVPPAWDIYDKRTDVGQRRIPGKGRWFAGDL